MMAGALLVAGLVACANKNAANAENNAEAEDNTASEEIEEQPDPYADLIPDSTGLFGMIPVHTFFAEWEKTENTKSYEDGQKVWRRHWEMVNEDFEAVKGNTIPTEVEEGVDATVVEPFTITGISGSNIYTYSIYVDLNIQAVIKVDPSVDQKALKLVGYDKGYNILWIHDFSSHSSYNNEVYATINFWGGLNAGYLSKLKLIKLRNVGSNYYQLNEQLDRKQRSYADELKMMHDSRKGQYTFDYGE